MVNMTVNPFSPIPVGLALPDAWCGNVQLYTSPIQMGALPSLLYTNESMCIVTWTKCSSS